MAGRGRQRGDDSRCAACSVPTLTQWVGQVAALRITADLRPLTPAEQAAARTPDRLIWCLCRISQYTPARLRWITSDHPTACPYPHLGEHRCQPEEKGTLW